MKQSLMELAGFGSTGFTNYKTLTIDNGSDISGQDATGNFVEVKYDENGNRLKEDFSASFEGVILFSRAVLTYRDKTQTKKKMWESDEFNPLLTKDKNGEKALIPIYRLDFNGKRQKDPQGNTIVDYVYYKDLQAGKKNNIQGMDYTYFIVLYVLTLNNLGEEEIIRLKFKGAGRGNYFNYRKEIWSKFRMNEPDIYTKFFTYVDKTSNKHSVAFSPIIQEDGQPHKITDENKIELHIQNLIEESQVRRSKMLPPGNNNILVVGTPNPTISVDNSVSTVMPTPTDTDQISIKEIPF